MIIKNNISGINTHRVLKFQHWNVDRNIEKLSSGMRINRAGDDASGLAVSEKMRSQIKGLRQAERNTEDGMSFIQTAEGYLQQISDIVQRIRVLAVQSANGTYTTGDREMIQVEVSQLIDEVNRVASQAEFNTLGILQGEFARDSRIGSMWFHMGANMHQRERVYISTMTAQSLGVQREDGSLLSISTAEFANEAIGVLDVALQRLNNQRADLGAYYNRLEHAAKGLMVAYENMQASESVIRDTDMAEEIVDFTKNQILVQTGNAMLSQANLRPQSVLQLFQ